MAAYDISYTPTSGTGPLKVTIDCDGGNIEFAGAHYVEWHKDNAGHKSHVFVAHFRAGNGSGPSTKVFNSGDFIQGKTVDFDASGTEWLNVVVLGPASSGGGSDSDIKKQTNIKVKI